MLTHAQYGKKTLKAIMLYEKQGVSLSAHIGNLLRRISREKKICSSCYLQQVGNCFHF